MMTWVYSRLDFHLEQLRGATDAPQRVLDLVREVADQLLRDLGLVERALLAVLARLLLDLDQFDDDIVRRIHLVHDHMHQQRLGVACTGSSQLRLEPAGREVVAAHRGHRFAHPLRIDEPVEQRAALHAAPRQAHHVFERCVREHAAPVGADHRDHRREMVEGRIGHRGRVWVGREFRERSVVHWGCLVNSRLIAAMSPSLRVMADFMSATRSRYFW